MASRGAQGNSRVDNRCVVVIGMHRSGTSATAGLLVRLGLTGPRGDDLIPATRSNEAGHWESSQVVGCNARLLQAMGGIALAPPAVTVSWESAPNYARTRDEALRWFATTDTGAPMMVKDPRFCSTLPFWRDVLPVPMAAVFVLRNPLNVARSLQARDGVPVTLGLAAWDRSMRSAVQVLEDLPTLVLDYDDMVADSAKTTKEIVRFLEEVGVDVAPDVAEGSGQHLDASLKHQKSEDDEFQDLARVQTQIFEALRERRGYHDAWRQPPAFPPPPLWVEDALVLRREWRRRAIELKRLRRSRVNRISVKLARLTGR
jgi:hypothetical protein